VQLQVRSRSQGRWYSGCPEPHGCHPPSGNHLDSDPLASRPAAARLPTAWMAMLHQVHWEDLGSGWQTLSDGKLRRQTILGTVITSTVNSNTSRKRNYGGCNRRAAVGTARSVLHGFSRRFSPPFAPAHTTVGGAEPRSPWAGHRASLAAKLTKVACEDTVPPAQKHHKNRCS
jgi:hypothetical protein